MDWVIKKYYYIINFKYFLRPRVYPVYFSSRRAAKRAIQQNIKNRSERGFYQVISGKKLMEFECKYVLSLGKLRGFTKYTYPHELRTKQQRKTYRTVIRRRLRRMGMLTPVKSKGTVGKDLGMVKLIKNKQWIANTPHTTAIAFTLERKGPKKVYVVLRKKVSEKRGKLFDVECLLLYRGKIKKLNIQITRKDVITPYLLSTIIKQHGTETIRELNKEGIRFDNPKQKAVLSLHLPEMAKTIP